MVSTRSKLKPSASRRTRSKTAGAPPALESTTPTKRKSTSSGKNKSPQRGQTPLPRQQPGAPNRSPMTPLRPGSNGAGPSHTGTIPKTRNPPGTRPRPLSQTAVAREVQSYAAATRARPATSQNNARAGNRNLPPTAPLSRANQLRNTAATALPTMVNSPGKSCRSESQARGRLSAIAGRAQTQGGRLSERDQRELNRLRTQSKQCGWGKVWKALVALTPLMVYLGGGRLAGGGALCVLNPGACGTAGRAAYTAARDACASNPAACQVTFAYTAGKMAQLRRVRNTKPPPGVTRVTTQNNSTLRNQIQGATEINAHFDLRRKTERRGRR